ncbi:MAG: TetR/AcrR family transcriptional regulator [Actinomycetota bacterium]|nr:TetR/AcrR family transcriptional regulator [Actinomycetota bacterium]
MPDLTALTPAARRILESAAELFYEHGVTKVGVELVAEQAGTTKKTLYDRFGSKEGLVVAYLEDRAARWRQHVERYLAATEEDVVPPDRPVALLDALESWMAGSSRGCGFVNAFAELAGSSPTALETIRAEKAWVRDSYAALADMAGHPDPVVLGRRLALVHEGAIVEATAGGSDSAMADARTIMRMLVGAPA